MTARIIHRDNDPLNPPILQLLGECSADNSDLIDVMMALTGNGVNLIQGDNVLVIIPLVVDTTNPPIAVTVAPVKA
jgi:hypothetical protein